MDSQCRNLVLITDGFPYGPGEKPFVGPELDALVTRYKVTLVAFTSKAMLARKELISTLPARVKLITYVRPEYRGFDSAAYLPYFLRFAFSRVAWREMRDLIYDGFSVKRLLDSMKQYALACHFLRFCSKRGLFIGGENTLYYSFWFGAQLLALSLKKINTPAMKIVSRIHGYDLFNTEQSHGRQPFERIKRDYCNRVIFVASSSREYFLNTFGAECHIGQYNLNRLGVHQHLSRSQLDYRISREREQPFLLVSCSNVIPRKRVDLIARALSKLDCEKIRWIHFGGGPMLGELKDVASNFGLNAEFRGPTANQDIIDFYQQNRVDCFILTTRNEGGCPVAIQEAISFGIPIIATAVGGVPETVQDNGILLSSDPSPDEVATAIQRIIASSESLWKKLCIGSWELWNSKFNCSVNKAELLELLDSV